jgi:hypothetical protein
MLKGIDDNQDFSTSTFESNLNMVKQVSREMRMKLERQEWEEAYNLLLRVPSFVETLRAQASQSHANVFQSERALGFMALEWLEVFLTVCERNLMSGLVGTETSAYAHFAELFLAVIQTITTYRDLALIDTNRVQKPFQLTGSKIDQLKQANASIRAKASKLKVDQYKQGSDQSRLENFLVMLELLGWYLEAQSFARSGLVDRIPLGMEDPSATDES